MLFSVVLINRKLALSYEKTGHAIILDGKVTDTTHADAEALEHEIRAGLPVGSSLATVDDFLTEREIEHSFVASSRIDYAIVNKLKGGSIFASKSLTFQFHFDDSLKLKFIDVKALYTGP